MAPEYFSNFIQEHTDLIRSCGLEPNISTFVENTNCAFCDTDNSPFACNPIVSPKIICYNPELIESLKLSVQEQHAMIFHELYHFNTKALQEKDPLQKEILCDQFACENGYSFFMLSGLYKIYNSSTIIACKDNILQRIDNLIQNSKLYRPEWTCGRYNAEKHVAIFYNLISGFSFFFDEYSADVIGGVLSSKRNEEVNIRNVAKQTGVAEESLLDFFNVLCENGLLTTAIPTMEGILNYRTAWAEQKCKTQMVEKSTKEKLPMDVSNAEQAYFDAVEAEGVVCSVMFELTYNCSEKCIHCYNPGATRNDNEVSHRSDREELQLDDYKRIIDDLDAHGLVKVCLSGGDPFSKPIAWDIIDYLYQKEIAFDVFTNGQRIVKDVNRLANYYPRLIGVSIYSGIAEDHDAITRMPGSWERSMQVVKRLSELAVPMNIKCCVMQPNLHSYYRVADLAYKLGAQPQFEINITDSNEGDMCARQLRLTEEQLNVVLRDNNIPLYVGPEAPNFGGHHRNLDGVACGSGKTSFCISPEGNLQPCCAFPLSFGNLKRQTIDEIFHENIPMKAWQQHSLNEFTECGRHDYCDYCNLCVGCGYIEHKDWKKPAESCCYMAKVRYNLAHKMMKGFDPLQGQEFVTALKALPKAKVVLKRQYYTKG